MNINVKDFLIPEGKTVNLKKWPILVKPVYTSKKIYTIKGDFQQAIQEYRLLLERHSGNPLLHFKLAWAYERSKRHNDAIEEYKISVKLAPDSIESNRS